jgi:hypothetical protein
VAILTLCPLPQAALRADTKAVLAAAMRRVGEEGGSGHAGREITMEGFV